MQVAPTWGRKWVGSRRGGEGTVSAVTPMKPPPPAESGLETTRRSTAARDQTRLDHGPPSLPPALASLLTPQADCFRDYFDGLVWGFSSSPSIQLRRAMSLTSSSPTASGSLSTREITWRLLLGFSQEEWTRSARSIYGERPWEGSRPAANGGRERWEVFDGLWVYYLPSPHQALSPALGFRTACTERLQATRLLGVSSPPAAK